MRAIGPNRRRGRPNSVGCVALLACAITRTGKNFGNAQVQYLKQQQASKVHITVRREGEKCGGGGGGGGDAASGGKHREHVLCTLPVVV